MTPDPNPDKAAAEKREQRAAFMREYAIAVAKRTNVSVSEAPVVAQRARAVWDAIEEASK